MQASEGKSTTVVLKEKPKEEHALATKSDVSTEIEPKRDDQLVTECSFHDSNVSADDWRRKVPEYIEYHELTFAVNNSVTLIQDSIRLHFVFTCT